MTTLTLGDAYMQTRRRYQFSLLAGEAGLRRSLRWLYFTEDVGNAGFLRGGELMFLTGHALRGQTELLNFVRMLITRNACGVVIPVGKYMQQEDLPGELLALCEAEGFPLLTIPWKQHFTDILQDFSRLLLPVIHEREQLVNLFQSIFSAPLTAGPSLEEDRLSGFYDPSGLFCIVRLSWVKETPEQERDAMLSSLQIRGEHHTNSFSGKVFLFPFQGQQVLVFYNMPPEALRSVTTELLALYAHDFPGYGFHAGISPFEAGFSALRECYERAGSALQQALHRDLPCVDFEELGFQQLLCLCGDPAILQRLLAPIAPIREYDKKNDGQLLETLRRYLDSNRSVNEMAEAMGCHRNTVNYRLRKIRELLGAELEDSHVLFRLQIALYAQEYLSTQHSERRAE